MKSEMKTTPEPDSGIPGQIGTGTDSRLNLLYIVLLLIFRFPLLIIPAFLPGYDSNQILRMVYTDATYLITGLFFINNFHRLASYSITRFFLILFVLIPMLTYFMSLFSSFARGSVSEIRLLAAIAFAMVFTRRRGLEPGRFDKGKALSDTAFSLLVALPALLISGIALAWQIQIMGAPMAIAAHPSMFDIILALLLQLSNAALLEEPLFRGILQTWFRRRLRAPVLIHLAQIAVFSAAHFYYIKSAPLSLLIVVPVGGLAFSFIVERSRSLTYSALVHGALNTLGNGVALLIAGFWFG